MANAQVDKYTVGFGLSLAIMSLVNAVILLVKELNPSVMAALRGALGHHWTTHGVIVIVCFLVLGYALSGAHLESKYDSRLLWKTILWAVVISAIVTMVFFFPELKGSGMVIKY